MNTYRLSSDGGGGGWGLDVCIRYDSIDNYYYFVFINIIIRAVNL